jgi:hypothetical protein
MDIVMGKPYKMVTPEIHRYFNVDEDCSHIVFVPNGTHEGFVYKFTGHFFLDDGTEVHPMEDRNRYALVSELKEVIDTDGMIEVKRLRKAKLLTPRKNLYTVKG